MIKIKKCSHCQNEFGCKSLKAKWCPIACKNIQYRIKCPDRVATQSFLWQRKNKDKIKAYRKTPTNKIAANLRSRLSKALARKQKTVSMSEYLGCSLDELKIHLESRFQSGMSCGNYGQWHIDHIKPLKLFDLSNAEELKKACHYTNLQPLWESDNKSKGDSYDEGQ